DVLEVATFAFGSRGKARVEVGENFYIATDAKRLDLDAGLTQLEAMATMVRADFPDWPGPEHPVPLLVFEDERRYRAFWPKLGRAFNSQIAEPKSDGYCVLGIAGTSVGDPLAGKPLRSVAVHEAFHAYFAEAIGLAATRGDWLHESLATYYQIKIDGVDLFKLPIGKRIPMPVVLTGQRPLGLHQYVQGAQFIAFMLDEYPREFSAAVQAMAVEADTNMALVIDAHFDDDLATIADHYEAWLRTKTGR
ncbi:MAG: hypothetical protein AAGK78_01195, partial [Planctomycetota bacterium]